MFRVLSFALLFCALVSCEPSGPNSESGEAGVYRDEVRFGLTFEERMAIPPKITLLHAEAQAKANAVYSKFQSRADAVRNEEYASQLKAEATEAFLQETGLTRKQLDDIITEYQLSLGAPLR